MGHKSQTLQRIAILLVLLLATACAKEPAELNIIPKPAQIEVSPCSLWFNLDTKIQRLPLDNTIAGSYNLTVTRHGVTILAGDESGFFYGLQTLKQILPFGYLDQDSVQKEPVRIPCLEITDAPRFAWRGLMLDCSRTFLPVAYLKKQIDMLSRYKMNVLHLHLTDDQGWRIEIKAFPELTAKCSESSPYYTNQRGGFYTQEELKDLVAFAAERFVTIVPEIEMPGHSSEIFAAYPQLSCTGKTTEIFPFFSGPGITEDILCAGKDQVFSFLEKVIDEVVEVFPSVYIHIGGDEAPKTKWETCQDCQRRIKTEGLKDEHELQSYFIKRMVSYIESKGRKAIGWDEILEGGLAEGAAVMSWRGVQGGIEAAKLGHPVVMSPTSHCYVDYSYWTTPVEKIYSFDPVPEGLPEDQIPLILGGQANMWTHIDRTEVSIDRQIYPRILALSESLWLNSDNKDFQDFELRLSCHYAQLDSLHISYWHPDLVVRPNDPEDIINKLKIDGYRFDFHGFEGVDFNYAGMACKIVRPDTIAGGHPWIWRARFWGHEPQTDSTLLAKGFHLVYADVSDLYGNPEAVSRWNWFYDLMQRGGLAKKVVLEGMSRGGLIIYNWAAENPEKVACIYADAPVLDGCSWPGGFGAGKGSPGDWGRFKLAFRILDDGQKLGLVVSPLGKAKIIAQSGIPLLHVVGDADDVVPVSENTGLFEQEILKYGGSIWVIHKPGVGHHPHSLQDPTEIVDFILRACSVQGY